MMKFLFTLFVGILPLLCFSQNKKIDSNLLTCKYDYVYLSDTLKNKEEYDLIILHIGENISKSFSYYSYQVDSIDALPNGDKISGKLINDAMKNGDFEKGNYPHKRMRAYVYKNYPEGKMTVTDGFGILDYIYEDELCAQDWQLAEDTTTILGYDCQMATCDFRGRQWTAWFATDIPISDGPWKFCGLPGLIMEVYDRNKQHHFTIIGLEKGDNEPIIFSGTDLGNGEFQKTNRIDFLKGQKRFFMDMGGYIEMETGIDLNMGKPAKVMRYDLLETDYR